MANHGVLIRNVVASQNVDSWNRTALTSGSNTMDNGNVFRLDTISGSSGYGEVWQATTPTLSGSTLNNLWMAASPETISYTVDGTLVYKGLNMDPRRFYNPAGLVFDAFKPQVGDIITLSTDCLTGTAAQAFANAADGTSVLAWGAAQTASALSLSYLATTYISIGSGAIDTQRLTAYKFVVLAN